MKQGAALIEEIDQKDPSWTAIRDRLERAAVR